MVVSTPCQHEYNSPMRSEQNERLSAAIEQLADELKQTGQWSSVDLSAAAYNSQQPFCLDTMSFSQWLQFVFIPRMQSLLDSNSELPQLPRGQGISPMAEEYFARQEECKSVVVIITAIDGILTL